MTGDAQINPPMDGQQLVQENLVLRAIVAELLMKNQNLRWTILGQGAEAVAQDPRLLMTSGGTPLRRNARTAGMP
jgi:hypothetical protein